MVVQHIAVEFAPSLARWLHGRSALPVRPVVPGDTPQAGTVLVAATDDHLTLQPDGRLAYIREPADHPYRPSVDVFFDSLARHWPHPGIALLLTGMGSDGAPGLLRLRQAGWMTLAQDQASCVVYGMPKAAAELNAACQILPLPALARMVAGQVQRSAGGG
jgi:two-component system response regulator WspF